MTDTTLSRSRPARRAGPLAAFGLLALGLLAGPAPAAACTTDFPIGTICTVALTFCPRGSMPAEGQILNVQQFPALFSLLAARYGGDGRATFALPDLRGLQDATGTALTRCIVTEGSFPMRP